MLKSICKRFRVTNVLPMVALFVALGGTAVAASVAANSVGTRQLRDQAVTTSKVKDAAVTGVKVAESTLGTVPSANNAATAHTVSPGVVHGAALGQIITISNTTSPFTFPTASTFVQCPAGTTLLSGGGESSNPYVVETLSRKSDPNGWRYDTYMFAGPAASITVYAYCLQH